MLHNKHLSHELVSIYTASPIIIYNNFFIFFKKKRGIKNVNIKKVGREKGETKINRNKQTKKIYKKKYTF